jgi:hypothetical protein
MTCDFCLEDTPLHAKYFRGAWFLACVMCDFRDEEYKLALEFGAISITLQNDSLIADQCPSYLVSLRPEVFHFRNMETQGKKR